MATRHTFVFKFVFCYDKDVVYTYTIYSFTLSLFDSLYSQLNMVLLPISKEDIHNITSGQVITELTSIVKELIENSIDADSTSISITFKNYGLEGLEVSDDGNGIREEDFKNLCLKNYTSKLENFENLVDVKTLGFRGEALNSICNICQVLVTTTIKNEAPKGHELSFDKNGELVCQKIVNHRKGTTIKISEIFKELPVRKLNMEKHYKREFQKCLSILTSYMIILTGIRIIVYNVDTSMKRKIMLKTSGNKLLKDNIVNVLGSTGLQGLKEIDEYIHLDDEHFVKVNGLLSSSSIGDGRLTKDRQYIFINKRPVDFKRILKLVNETYKKFNYLQVPVIVLNFEIHEHLIDINVTPDKRTILLSNAYENLLIKNLEILLETFWDNQGTYTIPVDDVYQDKIHSRNVTLTQPKLESFALIQEPKIEEEDIHIEIVERKSLRNSRVIISEKTNEYDSIPEDLDDVIEKPGDIESEEENNNNVELIDNAEIQTSSQSSIRDESNNFEEGIIKSQLESSINVSVKSETENIDHDSCCSSHDSFEQNNSGAENISNHENHTNKPLFLDNIDSLDLEDILNRPASRSMEEPEKSQFKTFNQKIRMSEHDLIFPKNKKRCILHENNSTGINIKASDFTNREESEKLLGLSIHKQDFKNMHIIGQFNKGFVIVHKKDTDDILIVDQHASDEKFNFERLIEETTFENQPLVIPQKLDLNSIEKLTISSHLDIFEKNGFKFQFSNNNNDEKLESDDVKQEALYLTSLPYSKNTIFDLKDLNELIQLVEDRGTSSKRMPRPSKVRSMFAMRACRSSIMIGQSLNRSRMENIVQNLSLLDKPWNCPHGRPTMRHLVKINEWKPFDDDYKLS